MHPGSKLQATTAWYPLQDKHFFCASKAKFNKTQCTRWTSLSRKICYSAFLSLHTLLPAPFT